MKFHVTVIEAAKNRLDYNRRAASLQALFGGYEPVYDGEGNITFHCDMDREDLDQQEQMLSLMVHSMELNLIITDEMGIQSFFGRDATRLCYERTLAEIGNQPPQKPSFCRKLCNCFKWLTGSDTND